MQRSVATARHRPSRHQMVSVLWMAVTLAVSGCDGEGRLKITVEHAAWGLMPDLEVWALPFDANALLDSLATHAPTPRPEFAELWNELQKYQRRDLAAESTFIADWHTARKGVKALSDSLLDAGRDSPGYDRDYARFRQLYRNLTTQEAALETEIETLTAGDETLADSAGAAAAALRQWESSTFADFDRLASEAAARTGRESVVLTTNEAGAAEVELPAGRWWLVARAPHPENPFVDLLWHVPTKVGRWLPVTTPLNGGNVTFSLRR